MNILHLPPEILTTILEHVLEPLLLDPIRTLRCTCKTFCFIMDCLVKYPTLSLSLEDMGDELDDEPDVIFFKGMIPLLNKQFHRTTPCNVMFNVPAFISMQRLCDMISTWWDLYVASPCIVKTDGGMYKKEYCCFSEGLFLGAILDGYDSQTSHGFAQMCQSARVHGMRVVLIIQQSIMLDHSWIPVLRPSTVYTLREHVELNQRHE